MPPPPGPEPEPPPPPTPPLPVSRASSSSALAAEDAFCFPPGKFPGARRPERLQGRCGAAFSALWEEGRAWELPFSVFPFWVPFFSVPSGDRVWGLPFSVLFPRFFCPVPVSFAALALPVRKGWARPPAYDREVPPEQEDPAGRREPGASPEGRAVQGLHPAGRQADPRLVPAAGQEFFPGARRARERAVPLLRARP